MGGRTFIVSSSSYAMATGIEHSELRQRESRIEDGKSSIEEKSASPIDEKRPEIVDVLSINSEDADEALELVGSQRTQQFSEEYNNKLRRKLVSLLYNRINTF